MSSSPLEESSAAEEGGEAKGVSQVAEASVRVAWTGSQWGAERRRAEAASVLAFTDGLCGLQWGLCSFPRPSGLPAPGDSSTGLVFPFSLVPGELAFLAMFSGFRDTLPWNELCLLGSLALSQMPPEC